MACNNQNIGLLTELVYKVKALALDVEKLYLEDDSLQEQIDKLALIIGAEGLQGYDKIIQAITNVEDTISSLIEENVNQKLNEGLSDITKILKIDPELDKDKYLYNDGENVFWKENNVDLSEVYDYINSLHPADIKLTISGTPSFGTREIGNNVVNPKIVCSSNLVIVGGDISDGNNTQDFSEGVTTQTFEFNNTYSKDVTFTANITGRDDTTKNNTTKSVVGSYKFAKFGYCIKTKTDTLIKDSSAVVTLLDGWTETNYSYVGNNTGYPSFSSVKCTLGNTGEKYQFFYLLPRTDEGKSVTGFAKDSLVAQFSLPVKMVSLGTVEIKNRFNQTVNYEIFTTNELVQDDQDYSFTIQ